MAYLPLHASVSSSENGGSYPESIVRTKSRECYGKMRVKDRYEGPFKEPGKAHLEDGQHLMEAVPSCPKDDDD
jgi:hypothetical protein